MVLMKLTYIVIDSDESIKQILKNKFNMSDRFILKLKSSNSIYINDVPVFINYKIQLIHSNNQCHPNLQVQHKMNRQDN